MASKKYPPGQKPSMAEAYKSAEKTVPKPPSPGSAAANRAAVKNVGKHIVGFFTKGGIPAIGKPEGFNKPTKTPPKPNREQAMADAYKTAQIVGNKPSAIIKQQSQPTKASATESTTTTGPKAKPYTKLKQASRESERRAFVQKRLEKLGITPAPAGKPRSAKEKAARQKARETWDKKNKFQKKLPSNTSSAKPEMEAE